MADTSAPTRFENPCPFPFTREQFLQLGERGFFGTQRVELLHGQVLDKYPDSFTGAAQPFRFTASSTINSENSAFLPGAASNSFSANLSFSHRSGNHRSRAFLSSLRRCGSRSDLTTTFAFRGR